jgi:hypothetical protein
LAEASVDPTAVCGRYEDHKRRHLGTEDDCKRQGLTFLPFVIEAHGGGLGPTARRVCSYVAKVGAAREGEEVEVQVANTMRRISISLQRENARAVLRRLGRPQQAPSGTAPEAWAEAGPWQ